MPTPRESLAAVVVGTQLYALGGHTTGGAAVATVEAYDGTANTWTTKASLPSARAALGAAVIGNVFYAVGGGETGAELNTLDAYDSGSTPGPRARPCRRRAAILAVAVVNGLLYAIGGDNAGTVEAYDPATNTWTTKASSANAREERRPV